MSIFGGILFRQFCISADPHLMGLLLESRARP